MKQNNYKWRKLGLVYVPNGEASWLHSHASVPIADHIQDDIYRIYFSSRDILSRSHTAHIVIDINHPNKILDYSTKPDLSPGDLGEFDDSGAMATWLVNTKHGKKYLYYIGWNLGVTVPFRNSIGLAIAEDNGKFMRSSPGPIMDRTQQEPHFCASCCVIPGSDTWRMWYLSCTGWTIANGVPRHKYHIKYAESKDGINWSRNGHIAIDYASAEEYAISRPSVIRDLDKWRMWFSHRGLSYKIGYAESYNGKDWIRKDESAGIDVSRDGWDSTMIEYPYVFDHHETRYMLYNGNDYGRTGFGLAVLE